ncbi:MAG: hypothetical protein VX438_02660, partial [Planctomycetota bacterium]|nr:hypothetical protein [Planctomycetota bacterium]
QGGHFCDATRAGHSLGNPELQREPLSLCQLADHAIKKKIICCIKNELEIAVIQMLEISIPPTWSAGDGGLVNPAGYGPRLRWRKALPRNEVFEVAH